MSNLAHASKVKPITIPTMANVTPLNVDRCQGFSGGYSQPSEDVKEQGRKLKVCVDKGTLEATVSLPQLEYGEMDSFLQLAGLSSVPSGGLTLDHFASTKTDIYQPNKATYGGLVEQTFWFKKLILNSFTLNIGDSESKIERTFELSGSFYNGLRKGNKCLIFKTDDVPSGVSGNHDIVVNDPVPIEDPNNTGVYILQLSRVRPGSDSAELKLITDYTYDSVTNTITVLSAQTDDHFRIWYSAVTYGSAGDPFVENDIDLCFLKANCVSIFIDDGVHTAVEIKDRLTSFSMVGTLNRLDEGAIGSKGKIITDVENNASTVSLGGFSKDSLIEEILMGQSGQDWGIIDPSLFGNVNVVVKVYTDSNKTTFKIGYKSSNMNFSDATKDSNVDGYSDAPVNLSSDNLFVTNNESDL